MPVKRSTVGAETFDKTQTAIDKLTAGGGTEQSIAQEEQTSRSTEERKQKPTSFYLDDDTLRKLDRLAYEYNQHTGKRINRNHIIRYLASDVELGQLLRVDLDPKKPK